MRLVLAGILCGLFVLVTACGPAAPVPPCTVTPSKQAAEQALLRAQQAYAPGKPLSVTINNQEATSLLRMGLEEAKTRYPGYQVPVEDPVLCFENGKAKVFGSVKPNDNVSVPALITLSATVTDGKPIFKTEQIQVGAVQLPPDLAANITLNANRLVSDYLGPISVTELRFASNQATVTGQVRGR